METYSNNNQTTDVFSSLFEGLEKAVACLPDYPRAYQQLNVVFQKCLNRNTLDISLNFGGTFAKTDYLLKEHKASKKTAKRTNDTRARLRKQEELSFEDMQKWFYYDLRNLTEFIAFLYQVPVPSSLQVLFPSIQEEEYAHNLVRPYIRLIVVNWDDTFLYGTSETQADGSLVKVSYGRGNRNSAFDGSYLEKLLFRGVQLNLIRPYEIDGCLHPEFIILEPDNLILITHIARCFKEYGTTPLTHAINKLQPDAISEPIVLGNFAGQLLDEQIHQLPESHTYNDSVMEFWQNNSINLLTAGISPKFHENAKKQKQNIAKAMGQDMPRNVADFNPKECMLEPSFYSEMLGLQGRMDLLQLDFKLLLEQKSGSADYESERHGILKQKEEHYVQMLLYMMLIRYNYADIYEKNGNRLQAFLLYSKFQKGLLNLGFAPQLQFEAIKVRNQLAWQDLQFTRPNGFRFLESLAPQDLNVLNTSSKLWVNHQCPQIQETLAPILQASSLERSYYFRFLTFISNEHMLSKYGNKTKENSGFASKWYDTLEEKRQAGNIYDNLTLLSPDQHTQGSIARITLGFDETDANYMSNFRIGDIIILYPYERGHEPDVRKTMVFRGSVQDITVHTIVMELNAPQSDAHVFLIHQHQPWAIEHDFMESMDDSLYKGLHAFLSAAQERKDLLLFQREPVVDKTLKINGDYGSFNELATRVKQARDFFLIVGPPGTGKTSFGMLNTVKEELTEPDSSVLLLSFTNRAVDEICSKLLESGIDFIRLGHEHSCSPECRPRLLSNIAKKCQNLGQLKSIITSARVMVATTHTMGRHIALFQLKSFSLAIIDETSQILEPHLLGLLSAQHNGQPVIRKFVMIGDHKQLPAVVQQDPKVSAVHEKELNDILLTDCRLSLFERLIRKYHGRPEVEFMLHKQGRMHKDIALFPNMAFYNSELEVVPLEHQNVELPTIGTSENGIDNLLDTQRIAFIHVDCPKQTCSNKVNQNEADIIAATVLRIYEKEKEHFRVEETVGIIVPYRNQIATVRNTIDRWGIAELHDITIDTVERYQGSQRKYIIYGFTVQETDQLNFLTNNVFVDFDGSIIDRKLNVAMTRAQEHLILVGNTELLSHDYTFHRLIQFCDSRNCYYRIPLSDYLSGSF